MPEVRHCLPHSRLYVITDRSLCFPCPLYDVIHGLLDAGVSTIQLREKDLGETEFIKLAHPISKLCRAYSARLFINSRIQVAMELQADGIHLPGDSASVREVIQKMEGRFIIGCSVHTLNEGKTREIEGADFITYSPIYPTASKPGYGPAVGLDNLQKVTEEVQIPVFALGGITPERISECRCAGAYGIAVMSGVMSPEHGTQRARAYLQQFAGNRERIS